MGVLLERQYREETAVKTYTVWEDYFHHGCWQVWKDMQLLDTYADREIAEHYCSYMNDREDAKTS